MRECVGLPGRQTHDQVAHLAQYRVNRDHLSRPAPVTERTKLMERSDHQFIGWFHHRILMVNPAKIPCIIRQIIVLMHSTLVIIFYYLTIMRMIEIFNCTFSPAARGVVLQSRVARTGNGAVLHHRREPTLFGLMQ
jgi:hypothetical protein